MIEPPQDLKNLLYSWKLIKQNSGSAYVGTLVTPNQIYYDYGHCDQITPPLTKTSIKEAWYIDKARMQ